MNPCTAIFFAGFHLLSWHSSGDFNNVNPGAFARAECQSESFIIPGIQGGALFNSERSLSAYLAGTARIPLGDFSIFGTVGGTTGYKRGPVVPLGGVGVCYNFTGHWDACLTWLPKVVEGQPHTIHSTIGRKF